MIRRWSRAAGRHLQDIHAFIAKEDPEAAARTLARLVHATERLETFPFSGRRSTIQRTHELVVPGLPYIVVYEVSGDAVEIHGVFHTARDPQHRKSKT